MSIIVTIAGTSGSGKSHLMRFFLDWARMNGDVVEEFVEGRVAPIGYLVQLKRPVQSTCAIYVIGGYEVPTGGCDTIHNIAKIFSSIEKQYALGRHVLYEGLFVMNQIRGSQLAAEVGENLCVLQLTTPLATCFASINERRAERGEGKLETKNNTVDNYRRATNYCAKMRDSGARVFKVDRGTALPRLLNLLAVSN